MRVVVSGTHASGKSTLIADFVAARPEYSALHDPFELVDEAFDGASAGSFFAQLQVAGARLLELSPGASVIAERGPLDFMAYLAALDELGRSDRAAGLLRRGAEQTLLAMQHVDLLVLLPLRPADGIQVPDSEDPELRDAMNDALLELADDPDLVGDVAVLEIVGDREQRLARLLAALA